MRPLPIGLLTIYVDATGVNSIGVRSTRTDLGGVVGTESMTVDADGKLEWLRAHGMADLAAVLIKMEAEGRAQL